MPPLPLRFVLSAPRLGDLAPAAAEVAIIGRSNVGKSSLVNALGGSAKLAMVSKTPGRTRLLNQFSVDDGRGGGRMMVDCPGYGYAKASATLRHAWQHMAEEYLLERDELRNILVLVDGEIGPTKLDVQLFEWLRAHERPFTVIATKHDKVKSSQREKRKRELATGCGVAPSEVVWVSAAKGVGIDRLRGLILDWLAV
ncbi:MAG TPA: ribosome biogenesis GTP-binding protein YihA/YsxC [Acidimicrobiales bacterium]|nr:ribosome biogenesis GTP-binding protein YihA/YsxC [Acidimicrobiales bacterium]